MQATIVTASEIGTASVVARQLEPDWNDLVEVNDPVHRRVSPEEDPVNDHRLAARLTRPNHVVVRHFGLVSRDSIPHVSREADGALDLLPGSVAQGPDVGALTDRFTIRGSAGP